MRNRFRRFLLRNFTFIMHAVVITQEKDRYHDDDDDDDIISSLSLIHFFFPSFCRTELTSI